MRVLPLAIALGLVACGPPARRPTPGAEALLLDRDLVVRRESDGVVSVLATVALDGTTAAGFIRLPRHRFETAARSHLTEIARARAWQTLARMVAADPERAYAAAKHGVLAVRDCADTRRGLHRASLRREEPGGVADAAVLLRRLLDDSLRACLRRNQGWVL